MVAEACFSLSVVGAAWVVIGRAWVIVGIERVGTTWHPSSARMKSEVRSNNRKLSLGMKALSE